MSDSLQRFPTTFHINDVSPGIGDVSPRSPCASLTTTSVEDERKIMKRSIPLTGISAVAVGLLLSACATSANNSGGQASGAPTESEGVSPKLTNCTNKIVQERRDRRSRCGPGTRTWPRSSTTSTTRTRDVQVCWTNVGQGNDEYDKVQTAISAEEGARPTSSCSRPTGWPSFEIQDALVDLTAVRRRRGEGQLQRRRLEGRLAGRRRSTRSRSTAARWA